MATIARVEIRMVDLKPKVKRVDAIQSFVSQETPFVRITDSDGAVGVGYSYTIGTGGPAIVELLARSLAPALLGRDGAQVEQIWRDLLFLTHATSVGAITCLALAAIDTALWDLRCRKAGLPLHVMAGGAKDQIRLYTTEGRLAASAERGAGRRRAQGQVARLRRLQGQGRPPGPRGRRAAGCAARGARRGLRDFHRRQSGIQCRRGDPPRPPLRGRRHRLVRRASARRRHRGPRQALAIDVDPHRDRREPLRAFTFSRLSSTRGLLHRPSRCRAHWRRDAVAEDRPFGGSLQCCGLPSLSDGTACRAVLRSA